MSHSSSVQYPETFADWQRIPWRALPREVARGAALAALVARYRASGKMDEGLAVPRVQFFCLHHLFPDEEEPFRALLRRLSEHFDFAPWSEGVRMVMEGRRPLRPVACFSSDDGLANNLAMGRVLAEFGTSGCFFVSPISIGVENDSFAARFCRVRLQALPARFLSWADLEQLQKQGHEVGNHTLTHVVCSETPAFRLAMEIEEAKAILEDRLGPIVHFAWPYGQYRHFSETARRLVFESGHVSAASVVRGAHLVRAQGPVTHDLCLRRDQLWATDSVEHTLYFTARNALNPDHDPDGFPYLVPGAGSATPSGLSSWSAIPWARDRPSAQYAPSPRTAARKVRTRMARSSQTDQFRT